ncbi:MAG: hypothetical protein U0Q18_02150 [Bryobacteraceae bacterium]
MICLCGAATRPNVAPNVIYTATGVFNATPVSGKDLFRLAGHEFNMSVTANEALVAPVHGAQWAMYKQLSMIGTVQSGLLPTPIAISNNATNILLAAGNPNQDILQIGTPVKVVGLTITITAVITMPKGTIVNDHIWPFTQPVSMTPGNARVTYVYTDSTGTNSTVLSVQQGTMSTRLTW